MKIAIVHSHDHRDHVMINRVISTLVEAETDVCVIDCAKDTEERFAPGRSYGHNSVRHWQGDLLNKLVWPIVRRSGSSWLEDGYWRCVIHLSIVMNALRLGRLAASRKPDRYLACDLSAAAAGLLARKLSRAPVIYLAYEIESEQGSGEAVRLQRDVFRAWESVILPRVDQLVTPNQARADFYAQRHRLRSRPVVVRNCPPRMEARKSKHLQKQLGLPDSTRIVIYTGALIPHRGLDSLVKSAALFHRDIVLVLIGRQENYYRDSLLPLLDLPQLKDRVVFLPYIAPPEIMDYISSADLGVVIYEDVNLNNHFCAPTKLYEYIMLGVPVIAPDLPEPRAVITTYKVGIIVDSVDPESIAAAVNSFFVATCGDVAISEADFAEARLALNWQRESAALLGLMKSEERQ